MQFTLSVLASLVPLTLAQYGGAPAPVVVNDPSTTTAAAPAATQSSTGPAVAIQTVSVGAGGNLAFSPNTLTAAVGSQVEFIFFPPTHTVTQGTFDNPCVASENNGTGFFSGDMTTASGMNANSFTITINDTNPIWFFCSFPTHCEFGMAGVINAPTDGSQTLAMFQAAAAKVSNPTAPTVIEGGVVGPVKAATAATQSSAGSSSATTGATTSSSSAAVGNAGVESRGGVQWVVLAITGIIAVGFGSLIV